MTKDQVNVDLFDECKALQKENAAKDKRIAELEKERNDYCSALVTYGDHRMGCSIHSIFESKCTCGYQAVLKGGVK